MPRRLDDWLKSYLQYMSFSEAPDHFHFWAGVATIAGALRRKVYFHQIYYRWSPNFYIIFVGPSGTATKSTAMHAAMDMLKEVQNIHFGPNAMTWQALLPNLNQAQEQILMPEGDYETQSCLTFAASEFGTLLDPTDRKMLDVLVDLWDGKTDAWRKATQSYGDQTVANPWLNIIACTTPSWITDNMPRHVIGGGFTSRCIFVYGDKKRHLVAYPKKEAEHRRGMAWVNQRREDLIHDLEEIASIAGEYELDKEAEEYGTHWYEELYRNPSQQLLVNNFDGYLARKQGHAHKVAMVVSAAYKSVRIITKDDLEKAVLLIESLETDMLKVFRHIKTDAVGARVDEVLQIMRIYGKLTRPVLYQMVFSRMSMPKQEFDNIVESACDAGVLRSGAGLTLELTLPSESSGHNSDREEYTSSPEADPSHEADDS